MTVPSSGDIAILNDGLQSGHTSLSYFVDNQTFGTKHLRTLGTTTDINNTGTHMSEFRGDPTYGSLWGQESGESGWARKTSGGTSYDLNGSSETRLARNLNASATWAVYADPNGNDFGVFDGVRCTVYRREKGTYGSWSQQDQWTNYVGYDYYCDFNNYDWKWTID